MPSPLLLGSSRGLCPLHNIVLGQPPEALRLGWQDIIKAPWSEGCTTLARPESVPNGGERLSVDMAIRNARSEHCIPGTRGGDT